MKKFKILIVEDAFRKRERIIAILQEQGISEFEETKYARDAVRKVQSEKYDLLITDLSLPHFEENGIEDKKEGLKMLDELAEAGINIPTIICSPTQITAQEREILKEIQYPLIAKVDDVEQLEKEIKKFLQN